MTDVLPLLADFQVGDQGWVWPAIGIGVVGVGVCIWISRNQFAQLSLSMLFRIFGCFLQLMNGAFSRRNKYTTQKISKGIFVLLIGPKRQL